MESRKFKVPRIIITFVVFPYQTYVLCVKEMSPVDVSFTHTKHVFSNIVFKIVHKSALFSESIVSEIYFE